MMASLCQSESDIADRVRRLEALRSASTSRFASGGVDGSSASGAVHAQQALLGRHTQPQGKAVMAGAAVHVHPIETARPEAVIGQRVAKQAQEGPPRTEAQQADLPAVGVTRQDEIALT